MALSMDEQRILAEIEESLARTEPGLAARLSSFGHPGSITTRSARALVTASCMALVVMAFVSMMLYALGPRRSMPLRGQRLQPTTAPVVPALSPRGGTGTTPGSAASSAAPAPRSRSGPVG